MERPKSQMDSGLQATSDFSLVNEPGNGVSVLRALLREELRLGFNELLQQLEHVVKPSIGLQNAERLEEQSLLGNGMRSRAQQMPKFSAPLCQYEGLDEPILDPGLRAAGNPVVLDLEAAEASLDAMARSDSREVIVHPFSMPDAGGASLPPLKAPICWAGVTSTDKHGFNMSPRSLSQSPEELEGVALIGGVVSNSSEYESEQQSEHVIQTIDGQEPDLGESRCVNIVRTLTGSTGASSGSSGKADGLLSPSASEEPGIDRSNPSKADVGRSGSQKAKLKRKQTNALFVETHTSELRMDKISKLRRITNSKHYEAFSGILILANAIYIGWQTQHLAEYYRDRAKRGLELGEAPLVFLFGQLLFTVLFIIELLPRWIADGFTDFFKTEDMSWNILDVVVVLNGIIESVLDILERVNAAETDSFLSNISTMRLLRIVRIVRVVRVIRVMRFFRELRMMVYSITGSMKNLLWVSIILGVVFYLFGVTFTSAVTNSMKTPADWNSETNKLLLETFGTVDRSALNLFMSMSGGNDWSLYYEALEGLGFGYRWFFLAFITFTLFAIVNVVTAVFVESAMQSNLKDRDIIAQEELAIKAKYLESMKELFEDMDHDGEGSISMTEFESKLQDERVIAFFSALKLDVSDARVLFRLIDTDKSGDITIDEFLQGCYKLQGESRSLDMKIMQLEVTQLREMMSDQHEMLQEMHGHAPPT